MVATPSETEIKFLLQAFKRKFGLMQHQIESYDNFIIKVLPSIIKENSIIVANYPVKEGDTFRKRLEFIFDDVSIQPPSVQEASGFFNKVTPCEARTRNITYDSAVFVTIEQRTLKMPLEFKDGDVPELMERKVYSHILLCRLPVMIGSSLDVLRSGQVAEECPYDDGGYFIINGMEKVVISQAKLRTNFPYVFPPRKNATAVGVGTGKSVLSCEVRSSHESKLRSTSTFALHLMEYKAGQAPELMVVLPYLECPISLPWVLLLLGWDPVKGGKEEIVRLVLGDSVDQGAPALDSPQAAMLTLVSAIAQQVEAEARSVTLAEVIDVIGRRGTREVDKERRDKYIHYILTSETLPHMGVDDSERTFFGKRAYIGHMLSKLLGVSLGFVGYDNRDHYANKRIDTTGPLMAHLFRQLYRSLLKSLQTQIQKSINQDKFVDIVDSRFVNDKRISGGFRMAFGTGNWGTPKAAGGQGSVVGQIGITQALSQMTGVSATAHGRRINTPIHKEGRNPKPRQLCNSAWGVVCPTETPEGIACGLVKNLAWGARVRVGTKTSFLTPSVLNATDSEGRPYVRPIGSTTAWTRDYILVTVNGVILGHCQSYEDAVALSATLKRMRGHQEIPFDASIALQVDPWQTVLRIHCDTGALLRPVVAVSRVATLRASVLKYLGCPHVANHLWSELLRSGTVEYIDKDEESTLRIAESFADVVPGSRMHRIAQEQGQPFTHVEMHPTVIHGLCASLIPFSNHNQSPRNTYQSAMGKQALGIPATNFHQRMDAMMHVLCSPQRPLVSTWMEKLTSCHALPAGQNVMVAIMCHTGFNQEDSLVMCRSSVEAGMFHSVAFRTFKEEACPNGTDIEKIEIPNSETCTRLKAASYAHLDPETGAARVGSHLRPGDVIIGKTVVTTDSGCNGKVRVERDQSLQVRGYEEGQVDRVVQTHNQETNHNVRVRTQRRHCPMVGDKFSSRHGQKGVVGVMLHRSDMPFTDEGITPDIIVNPHAIPSRMTIGHLFETLLGTCAVHSGELGDGTPFRDLSVEQVADAMEELGFDRYCNTYVNCGLSGKRLEAQVFLGVTYYQRLKHMVNDKMHARSRGPVQPLTRQPVEGRSREGGLRIGEMERDALAANGASANARERLFEASDPNVSSVCTACGLLADMPSEGLPQGWCQNCDTAAHVQQVALPFATKLTFQEMMALHMTPRLRFATLTETPGEHTSPMDQHVKMIVN